MARVRITAGDLALEAEFNESATAHAVLEALPVTGRAARWGDEIYFTVNVSAGPDEPAEVVQPGDIAFWPPGSALCVFWGPTPASHADEIRPASPVNVIGRISGDLSALGRVSEGTEVRIDRI